MLSDPKYLSLTKEFWADVRMISQLCGYTERGLDRVKVPKLEEVVEQYKKIGLKSSHLIAGGTPTQMWSLMNQYFNYRAHVLDQFVKPNLMDVEAASKEFEQLRLKFDWSEPLPMNKQKGAKKQVAYLTAMTQMLIKSTIGNQQCDFDPRSLTSITRGGKPLRTLARRVDGAFPSVTDPLAIWEIKEYYYTTTFGSRIADGVYETLLDGMELEELLERESRKVEHYLIVDSFTTWWLMGKSYLCRMVDMQHMGYVDEVLFGREIVSRLPEIAKSWLNRITK